MITVFIVIVLYFFIGSFLTAIAQYMEGKDIFDTNNDSDIASSVVIWPAAMLLYLKTLPYIFVRTFLNTYIAIKVWCEVIIGILY